MPVRKAEALYPTFRHIGRPVQGCLWRPASEDPRGPIHCGRIPLPFHGAESLGHTGRLPDRHLPNCSLPAAWQGADRRPLLSSAGAFSRRAARPCRAGDCGNTQSPDRTCTEACPGVLCRVSGHDLPALVPITIPHLHSDQCRQRPWPGSSAVHPRLRADPESVHPSVPPHDRAGFATSRLDRAPRFLRLEMQGQQVRASPLAETGSPPA